MAFGTSSRLDSRRALPYCSTTAVVVFVALGLIGVWILSSTFVPAEISDNKSEINSKLAETDSRSFENRQADVTEDSARTYGNDSDNNIPNDSDSGSDKPTQTSTENTEVDNPSKASDDSSKDESQNASQTGTFSDNNGEDGGDSITQSFSDNNGKVGGETMESDDADQETDIGSKGDHGNSKIEERSKESENDQQTNEVKKSDQYETTSKDGRTDDPIKEKKKQDGDRSQDEKNEGPNEEKFEQDGDGSQDEKNEGPNEEKSEQDAGKDTQGSEGNKERNQLKDTGGTEVFPSGAQSELLNETNTHNGAFSTQAMESKNEKELQKNSSTASGGSTDYNWKLCQVRTGEDYIPCLDNEAAIKMLHFTGHFEHRERHCPEEAPTCLVPLPSGYKPPIRWPISRDKIWYTNVPHTKLAQVKGHQNWVNVSGDYIYFPGGGTQFIHGALHYIDLIQESHPDIAWGKRSRVVLDVGCGVASFGGFLFDRDVITMSFAPKDEHEAQVQFALERGIPAFSAVMGTKRLPFPSKVFDVIHCARCRVPWHIEGGMLLLELNRLLRPGGYFVWSATPVYRTDAENVEIWEAMTALTKSMCWEMVTKTRDSLNQVALAIYRKPSDNTCYEGRAEDSPPLCQESDDPDAAWNITLQACMHRLPVDSTSRGKLWPEQWPLRLEKVPYWLSSSQTGVYGNPAPQDFIADYEHWKRVISKSYINGMGINWSTVRNVMDMRSVYGGFAAALREKKVWVMNIVSIDSPDTLPIIYERGLFGMYHDWCESFSTYPRSYDLLHADHLFSKVKKKCQLLPVIVEADRILRPQGKLLVRDDIATISEVENLVKSLHWEIRLTYSKGNEGLLCAEKTMWRPS